MRNECLDLINTKIETKVEDKTLTENLKEWRQDRNITKADYLTFVGNVLEELLEPVYDKVHIPEIKRQMLDEYFLMGDCDESEVIDAIKDIKVFCVNETELMGYCDIKTDEEVFKEINSRVQDPQQKEEWKLKGAYGKWKKYGQQDKETLYKANYGVCKL